MSSSWLARREAAQQHFGFVDGLRGLACLWVVLNHLKIPELAKVAPPLVYDLLVERGGMGVLVFFVVSGFVIAHSLLPVELDTQRVGNFLARRVVRLSPPYYASLVVAVVVSSVAARVKSEEYSPPGIGSWSAHLTYLPHLLGLDLINGVHWTLYLEMQFYLAFVGVLWWMQAAERRRPGRWEWRAALLASSALVWPLAGWSMAPRPVFLAYWFAFVSGVLVCWRARGLVGGRLWWACHLLLVAAWVLHGEQMVATVVLTAPVLWAATRGDRMSRWLRGRSVQFLATISYSLYLVHAPVIGVVDWVRARVFGDGVRAEAVMLVPTLAASILAGWMLWWAVERPAIRWSRSLRVVRPAVTTPGAAGLLRRRSG